MYNNVILAQKLFYFAFIFTLKMVFLTYYNTLNSLKFASPEYRGKGRGCFCLNEIIMMMLNSNDISKTWMFLLMIYIKSVTFCFIL